MKHTPGPWQRFDDGGEINDQHVYGPEYADVVWGPDGPGHGVIADCSPHGQCATEETIANARLIAAAPDLLVACKATHGVLLTFEQLGLLKAPHEQQALDLVRNAITKVFGEASPGGA